MLIIWKILSISSYNGCLWKRPKLCILDVNKWMRQTDITWRSYLSCNLAINPIRSVASDQNQREEHLSLDWINNQVLLKYFHFVFEYHHASLEILRWRLLRKKLQWSTMGWLIGWRKVDEVDLSRLGSFFLILPN